MKNITFNYEFSFFGYSFNFSMNFIDDNYECTIYCPMGNKQAELYSIICESENYSRFESTIIEEICNVWVRSKEYKDLQKSPKFIIETNLLLTPAQIRKYKLVTTGQEKYDQYQNDFVENPKTFWFFEANIVCFSKNQAKKLRKLSIKNSSKFPFHTQSASYFVYKAEQAKIAGTSIY